MSIPASESEDLVIRKIQARIDKMEKESRLRFIGQVFIGPGLMALIGLGFGIYLEQFKADLQSLDKESKRVEAITGMIPHLSAGPPERALLAEAVVSHIVNDQEVKDKIARLVALVATSGADAIASKGKDDPAQSTSALSQIQETAKRLDTGASKAVEAYFDSPSFYVVVESERDQQRAIESARRQKADVYATTNPYFAVVMGASRSFSDAKQAGSALVTSGRAKEFFILPKSKLTRRVFPQ